MSRILGVNTRYFPAQASVCVARPLTGGGEMRQTLARLDQSDNPPPTVVVLVGGDIGDYAAYAGHGHPSWVALHGDKISFEEACCHFPGGQLEREKYRV